MPYRPIQLFELVADVERYPEFLPWCTGARIRERSETRLVADLLIGFKMIRERWTSEVRLDRAAMRIDTGYRDGPFRHMTSYWIFHADGETSTRLEFFVDFEFRSMLLDKLIGVVFHEAVRRMVQAFETRANALYGASLK